MYYSAYDALFPPKMNNFFTGHPRSVCWKGNLLRTKQYKQDNKEPIVSVMCVLGPVLYGDHQSQVRHLSANMA